jgi:hypothetical protein
VKTPRKAPATVQAKEEAEPESDEAAISDFEAILQQKDAAAAAAAAPAQSAEPEPEATPAPGGPEPPAPAPSSAP